MTEIVGACLSQFHDDADSFELLMAFSDGREVGHTVSRTAAKKIADEFANEFGSDPAPAAFALPESFVLTEGFCGSVRDLAKNGFTKERIDRLWNEIHLVALAPTPAPRESAE